MASESKRIQIAKACIVTAEVMGHELSTAAAEAMADDLAEFSLEQVAGALKGCRREVQGRLTLASVLEQIEASKPHRTMSELTAGQREDMQRALGEEAAEAEMLRIESQPGNGHPKPGSGTDGR